jgi:hypothetical protein
MDEVKNGILAVSRIVDPVISRELLLASSTKRPSNRSVRTVAHVIRKLVADMRKSYQWPHSTGREASAAPEPAP